MPLAPGDVVAGYTVMRALGSGGMGTVYLVRHPRLPRLDALKLLRPDLSTDPDFAARFHREADVVAGLSHRNIVPVLDRGEEDGRLWLTMPYIDGIDAETALGKAGGLFPAERAVRIVTEVAAALDSAHRQHLVHRDVKPANILLTSPRGDGDDEPEEVFLTDFGIAKSLESVTKLTRTGAVLATFDYASPEQIQSWALDARSDVYSLGCVLHRLLTGSVPYPGSLAAAVHGHLLRPAPRPTELVPWLGPGLDDVVAQALAKDPADRYPTCRALAAAAAAAATGFPAPPPPPYRLAVFPGDGGTGAAALSTDRLSAEQTERLVALVRRMRFFDLPESLPPDPAATAVVPRPGRTVMVEIRAGDSAGRVVADLDSPRRPPGMVELVSMIERLPDVLPTSLPPIPPSPAPVTITPQHQVTTPAMSPQPAAGSVLQPATQVAPLPVTGPPSWDRPPPAPPDGWSPSGVPGNGPHGSGGRGSSGRGSRGGGPGRRRPLLLLAVVALLVAAGGTVAALLLTSGNGRKTSTAAATSSSAGPSASDAPSPATSPAGAALAALPRSAAPLAEGTLVIPRQTGDGIHLYLVDSTDGTSTQVTSSSSPDVGPVLSPDRRSIAFLRGNADGTAALMVQPAAGGEQQPLIRALPAGCVRPGRPAWNPADPTEIALPCADAQGTLTLRVVALDGTVVTTLAAGPIFDDVAFSPDGTHVVYWAVTRRGPGIDGGPLYSIAVDGGSPPLRLTDVGSVDADPDFSPDGRSIVFRRAVSSTDVRICLMRADGSGLTYLTSGHIDQDPTWSPDGSRLAFKSDRPGAGGGDQIWVMDTSGQGLRQLSGVPGTSTNAPAWGPR